MKKNDSGDLELNSPPMRAKALLTVLTGGSEKFLCSRPSVVLSKLSALLEGGSGNLCVVSDFDRTITALNSRSSHGVVEQVDVIKTHPGFSEVVTANSKHYYPIEVDPKLSIQEKLPFMVEWYTKVSARLRQGVPLRHDVPSGASLRVSPFSPSAGDIYVVRALCLHERLSSPLKPASLFLSLSLPPSLPTYLFTNSTTLKNHAEMCKVGITKGMITEVVESGGGVTMRDGADEVIDVIEKNGVPLLIFSAGLADVIEEVLQWKLRRRLGSKTKVVSNRMIFDKENVLVGVSEPLIHMFNKNLGAVPQELQPKRKNVLLLGDGMGDVTMADGGSAQLETVLKIGFLNKQVQENHEKYDQAYDILITDDSGMKPVETILKEVLKVADEN